MSCARACTRACAMACAALAGGQLCIKAHDTSIRTAGGREDQIHDAVRTAAVRRTALRSAGPLLLLGLVSGNARRRAAPHEHSNST